MAARLSARYRLAREWSIDLSRVLRIAMAAVRTMFQCALFDNKVRSRSSMNKRCSRMRCFAAVGSRTAAAGAALALLAGLSAAAAPTAVDFFRGKTISLLIGFGPGGEDDLWARIMSRY